VLEGAQIVDVAGQLRSLEEPVEGRVPGLVGSARAAALSQGTLELGLAGLQSADASGGRVNQTLSNSFGPLQPVSLLLRGVAVNPALRSSREESEIPQELTEIVDEGDNLGPGDEQSRRKFAAAL
jgi:hypothetical protein